MHSASLYRGIPFIRGMSLVSCSGLWRGGCALAFAGINLLVYLDFPSLICLNEFVAKFIPNWNCHYWVSQQTELTQSKTPPTAITDSIILSKGTWSIKEIYFWKKWMVLCSMWPLMCHFSSYLEGGVPAILDIIYVFLWHESEAQRLSAHCNKQVEKHFSLPSLPFGYTFISRMADVPSPLLG